MEEDIEILESFIKQLEEFEDEEELKQAIANLINRVKELEEELDRQINARIINEEFIENNFISKDKIKAKIEELEKDIEIHNIYEENWNKIEVLQELLEE